MEKTTMETTTTTKPDAATPQRNWLEIAGRGLKFSRFSTPTQRRLIGKAGGPGEQHIYEIDAKEIMLESGGCLTAILLRDGHEFARLFFSDERLGIGRLEKMAIAAFAAFLHAGQHRARNAARRCTIEQLAADKSLATEEK